jgi:hypothetical protein
MRRRPLPGLVHQLMEAHDERLLLKLQAQLAAVKLLIVDELGYVPLSQTGADSSRSSASVMNAARPSPPQISHSRNGPASSAARVSPARSSIASPTMSIWSSMARATGSSNRRHGGNVTRGPPTRPLQLPIQKPAKPP